MFKLRQALVFVSLLLIANTGAAQQKTSEQHLARIQAQRTAQRAWMKEAWTGNEKLYSDARIQLDKIFKRGQSQEFVIRTYKQYEAEAKKNSQDALSQFKWGYASYKALKILRSSPVIKRVFAYNAMERVPFPRTYEFARAQFLLKMLIFPDYELRPVAERLVMRNSNDYDVVYYYTKILRPDQIEEREKTIKFVEKLVKTYPQKPSAYSALGSVYHRIWLKTRNSSDGEKAVSAYRKFLDMVPSTHPGRSQTEGLIKRIQKG